MAKSVGQFFSDFGNAISSAANWVTKSVGSVFNDISGTTAQNEFNAQEAQKQRDFEERMSNSSYQRAVSDMQNAGLNPVMGSTSGASTPGGASASGSLGAGVGIVPAIISSSAKLLNANDNTRNSQTRNSVYSSAKDIIKVALTMLK